MVNNLQALLRNEKLSAEHCKRDGMLKRHKAYFLPGNAIKTDVECYARICIYKTDPVLDTSLSSAFGSMSVSSKN